MRNQMMTPSTLGLLSTLMPLQLSIVWFGALSMDALGAHVGLANDSMPEDNMRRRPSPPGGSHDERC